jgi:hypothetical protein
MKALLAAAAVVAALAAVPTASATNECKGLNPCVAIAGPWVVVPAKGQTQYQLTCPKGFIVAGLDAEMTDPQIDLSFLGFSGAPVGPGVTTSQTVVFVATYVGSRRGIHTYRPHAGCIPATGGGGSRTPTGVRKITPPGHPTTRRVATRRVAVEDSIVVSCKAGERLVSWYVSRGFGTPDPPGAALVTSLVVHGHASGKTVTADIRARLGQGMVQVGAVCAGGA